MCSAFGHVFVSVCAFTLLFKDLLITLGCVLCVARKLQYKVWRHWVKKNTPPKDPTCVICCF